MKPDWEDAPEWANWLAMDEDGEWRWHARVPVAHRGRWLSGGMVRHASYQDVSRWEETEERRPETFDTGLPEVALENGHALVDCGTGDYCVRCPTHGGGPWMHLGIVMMLMDAKQAECVRCGLSVKPQPKTTTPQPEGQGAEGQGA